LFFKSKKPARSTGRSAGLRDGRTLALELLEDRRLLAFSHPGLLHTADDFDRMADKVAAGAQPWTAGWNALTSHGYSQLNADPRPLETVIRGGDGQNFNQMVVDIQRAYMTALRWKVTGDTRYADQTVEFLNAWSSTMTTLTGNADRFLAAGIYGYEWANIAEIMRDYSGWAPADVERFKTWLLDEYYPLNHQFLTGHNGAAITNYWANWDLCNMASVLAIGVFTDRQDLYDEAMAYFHDGGGNGGAGKWVYHVHDGNLGQWQESGRDQGHTTFGISLVGPFMQMAYNQGDDLFAYDNNRFLAGAEYVAKYNLGYDVPFETYNWGTGQNGAWQTQTVVSAAGRGNGRPAYELVYNHYVNVMGIAAPYSEERVEALAPEGASGNGDELGFGTLTFTRDPIDPSLMKPSGLTARNEGDAVRLNWWGAAYADTHNVYRASSETGVYELIASGITDLLTFADYDAAPGENFYKVTALIDGVETAASDIVPINTTPQLIVHLPFDESTGTTAGDSSGNSNPGTLVNGATWTTGKAGNAVSLSGAGQYVSLVEDIVTDVADFTISAWVNVSSTANWMRIFDLGENNGRYMYLTPRNGGGVMRFAIGTNYWYNEQAVETAALPVNQWSHVAVTLTDNVLRIYVNGVLSGSTIMSAIELAPFRLSGSADNNWIGRSQYGNDPYFNGKVDDFRIYSGALTTGEVYQLATSTAPPAVPPVPATLGATAVVGNRINLSWTSVPSARYTIRRGTEDGGPYTVIATRLTGATYADTGLTADTTYHYVVTADNAGGESAFSPQASATALPPLPGIPTNLTAGAIAADKIKLNWTAAANATTYTVKRSDTSGGPYATIATGVTAAEFTDEDLTAGATYYYVVSAVNSSAESAISNEASAVATGVRARWKFNESAGAVAADVTSNWDGMLVNSPTWVAGRVENGVNLDGIDDLVTLPTGVVDGLTDYTIATWVALGTNSNWSRIFDFGSGTDTYMFLTPKNGTDADLRFTIKAGGVVQDINTSSIVSTRGWTHLALTWTGNVGILYMNGVEIGRNNAMTLNPSSLGTTTQNYIGKSQYADPYLLGKVDDFRIYNRALSPTEIGQLTYVPPKLGDYDLNGTVNGRDFLAWQRQFSQTTPVYQQADGDGSGVVDAADLAVWSNYYGTPAPLIADDDLAEDVAAMNEDAATDSALAKLIINEFDVDELNGFWLPAWDEAEPSANVEALDDSSEVSFSASVVGDASFDHLSVTPSLRDDSVPDNLRTVDSELKSIELEDSLVSETPLSL
jgi:hypothetical protein